MSAALMLTCRNMFQSVTDTGKEIAKGIYQGYDYVGRKIEHISSSSLGNRASGVIAGIYWSLPYTALLLNLPARIVNIGLFFALGFWGAFGHSLDSQIGREDRARMFYGIRNFSLLHMAVNLVELYANPQLETARYLASWTLAILSANTIATEDTPPRIEVSAPQNP